MTVQLKHIRQLGYCRRGAVKFFARHGWDWSDFLRNGIDAEKLIATGDAMAMKAVEVAKNGR